MNYKQLAKQQYGKQLNRYGNVFAVLDKKIHAHEYKLPYRRPLTKPKYKLSYLEVMPYLCTH